MQINRMFEIIYILIDKKIVTARELAQRFEVSQRTIYRDIETLSSAGIPVFMSRGKGESLTREIEPLRLCFKGISRYLYAYCTLRQDFRFFKLSRIRGIVITDKHFERKVIDPIFKSNNILHEQDIALKLRLSPSMAFRVYDEFDSYIQESDGSFIVQTIYPAGKWLFSYIFSFGRHCEVLEPPDIRNSIKEELQIMINNYL